MAGVTPGFSAKRRARGDLHHLSSLIFLISTGKLTADTTSGVNAQLTPTGNSPGSHMMLDTRSSPEAGGFQSLFASATQHTRGSDGYPTVPSPAEKFSGSAESAGVGNRRKAASKTSGDSGGLGSALAGLAIPPPAAIRSQEWAPSDGKNDEVALVGTAGSSSSQAAGPTAAANFRLDTRFIWPGETKTGDAGSLDNPQIPPLSDFAGSVASASKDANGIEAPLFGDLGGN